MHFLRNSGFFQGIENELLFVWRQQAVAATTLEVWVTGKLFHTDSHELLILRRVHLLLEVGESAGINNGLIAAIVWARVVLRTSGWVDHTEVFFFLLRWRECYLMQAGCSHWAVGVLADCIIGWNVNIWLLWHIKLRLIKLSANLTKKIEMHPKTAIILLESAVF